MLTSDVMTKEPACIAATGSIPEAARLMKTRGVGMLPIVEDLEHRRLVGILTDRDIVLRFVALEHGPLAYVRDHMTRDPLVVAHESSSIAEVAALMSQHQVRRLPVVDEHGALVGVVAHADLLLKAQPHDAGALDLLTKAIYRPGALVH